MKIFVYIFLFLSLSLLNDACAVQNNDDEDWVKEKLGRYIPPDIRLSDENGTKVNLKNIIDKPAVLIFVYYSCSHLCPQVLGGLAEEITGLKLVPGKDYEIITISFDDKDTPETARVVKNNYIKAINRPFPEDAWKFLTGDKENIDKTTNAVGFTFREKAHGFVHPVVAVILSPEGKISGYLHVSKYAYGSAYPVTFSSYDLVSALNRASMGKISTEIRKSVLYCFPHEPEGQKKYFRLLKVAGTITLALILCFFIYLRSTAKKHDKGGERLGQ